MKKLLILCLSFLFISGLSALGLKKGIMAGANFANATGDDAHSTDMRFGGDFGVFAIVDLPMIDIQPEVHFTMKGATSKLGNAKYDYKCNYVEIPVLIKYNLPVPLVNPSLFAGPAVGINVSKDVSSSAANNYAKELENAVRSNDISLVMGASVQVFRFYGDVRYNMGLTSFMDDLKVAPGQTTEVDLKNATLQVMLGYLF